jgi:hypothetical protein
MLDMANKEQRLGNDGVRWLGWMDLYQFQFSEAIGHSVRI